MANSTIANLTPSGALTGTELFYSDNGAADVKVTANQLKTFVVSETAKWAKIVKDAGIEAQ